MKLKQLVRLKFRTSVFERDGYRCKICGIKPQTEDELDAHHITDRTLMPNQGYVKENGITVCLDCHLLCEQFHISDGQEWAPNLHPNDLYQLIGCAI
jgi:predicted restriction endonuclease